MNKHGRIKKGDKVVVISGKYSKMKGEVLKVIPDRCRAIVSGVNIMKKRKKPTKESPGEIVKKEASIHISNLAIENPSTGKPDRIGFKFLENGKKIRFCKKTGDHIDV